MIGTARIWIEDASTAFREASLEFVVLSKPDDEKGQRFRVLFRTRDLAEKAKRALSSRNCSEVNGFLTPFSMTVDGDSCSEVLEKLGAIS